MLYNVKPVDFMNEMAPSSIDAYVITAMEKFEFGITGKHATSKCIK